MSAEGDDRLLDLFRSPSENDRLRAARETLERDEITPQIDQAVREAFVERQSLGSEAHSPK